MTREEIINGLKMSMELTLFDPSTGEVMEPQQLNDINRTAYDAYKGAIELLEKQPELDIGNDGTLHISVTKGQLNNIGRVLVEEDGTIFCKLFYQDAEPERKTGRWIESNPQDSKVCRLMTCSECGKAYIVNINVPYEDWTEAHKFCVECGTKMKNGDQG